MKIKNITFALVALAAAGFSSCGDFLDVKPAGKTIPETASELEWLLNSDNTLDYMFMNNNRGSFYSMLGDNFEISPVQAANYFTSSSGDLEYYAAYTFYKPYQNPNDLHYTWNWGIYRAVSVFNTVIEGVADLKASERESTKATEIVAQAKAGRAWALMNGALGYGPAYKKGGDNSTRVLPYRTIASADEPSPELSTMAQIFELALNDLDDALAGAPAAVPNPSRASKAAVHALRAEYFMYAEEFDKMLYEADQALTLSLAANRNNFGALIYDYNLFSYIEGSPSGVPGVDDEVNWSLKYADGDTDFNRAMARENLFYRVSPRGAGAGSSANNIYRYPSEEYLALFDPDTDRRYQLFALRNTGYGTDGIRRFYYRDYKTLPNQGITYPVLLLMRAEANVRANGDLDSALADLNTLRKYRYSGGDTDWKYEGSLTADMLLEEILAERRREQPGSSFHRVHDLKRFAAYDQGKPWAKSSVTHTIGAQTYTSAVSEFTISLSNEVVRLNPQWGIAPDTRTWAPK